MILVSTTFKHAWALRLATVMLFALTLGGCANMRPMAYGPDADAVKDAVKQPIFLATVTVKHPFKTYYLPKLIAVRVVRGDGKADGDLIGFRPDDPARDEMDNDTDGNRYFLRLPLDSSKQHSIKELTFLASKFPLNGFFGLPLNADLAASGPGVYYLGHIEASVRERKDNEFRAGPVIPLIDQSITGASSGTWDVTIEDRWATDEALFKKRLPALVNAQITKKILPPFDRARAQREWEGK